VRIGFDGSAEPLAESPPARDGRPVLVRRVRPDDGALIDAFVKALSPAARLGRFHAAVNQLAPAWLHRMTHPQRFELSLLAVVSHGGPEVCIGEARYAVDAEAPADEREFALVVADAWQGAGIGARLLRALSQHAERCGVSRLYGDVLRDNLPMLALARSLGFATRRHPGDARLLRVAKTLNTAPARIADETAGGARAMPTQPAAPILPGMTLQREPTTWTRPT
jgi:acetyltransferase